MLAKKILFIVLFLVVVSNANNIFAAEPLRLIPPADSSKETRIKDILSCHAISQQIARVADEVSPFERAPLLGQVTGRFIGGGRPSADENAIPTRYSSLFDLNWGGGAISDRYVLCLLSVGYKWPESVTGLSASESNIDPDRESLLLYNSGITYRRAGFLKESERLLRRSFDIEEKLSGAENVKTGRRAAELAAVYAQLGRFSDGLAYVKRLLPLAKMYSGEARVFVRALFELYEKELRKLSLDADASSLEEKITELTKS